MKASLGGIDWPLRMIVGIGFTRTSGNQERPKVPCRLAPG